MKSTLKWASATLAVALLGGALPALGSSHREAPLISEDPAADSSDFYMFRSPTTDTTAANTVTFVANYWPMQEPGGGPNWAHFADNVLYEIKIDNDGDAREDITYQFRFTTTYKKGLSSFLFAGGSVTNVTDPNVVQTYTVTRVDKAGNSTVVANNVPVPPPYLGDYTIANYSNLANTAITTLGGGGGKVFAGQREDPFYADLGAIFDLVRIRCNTAATANNAAGCAGTASVKGVDFLAGYNVHSIVLQVPIVQLTSDGTVPTASSKTSILGAWTTASRQRVVINRTLTVAASLGGVKVKDVYGPWVQISRLGLPLINEVIMPVALKDYYNTSSPADDAGLFGSAVGGPLLTDPELARAFKAFYGITIPAAGRTDLLELLQFHLATSEGGAAIVPFKGKTYALAAADILRVDVALPAPANQTTNPLGAVGALSGMSDTNIGFPNGRRLHDDVVDILERVVGGGILRGYGGTAPNNALGDAVAGNDAPFLTVFPYVPPPWSGSKVGVDTTNSLLHQFR